MLHTKQLRKIHKKKFTRIEEVPSKKDEYKKVRVENSNYISFRQWLRDLSPGDFDGEKFEGKASNIVGGAR